MKYTGNVIKRGNYFFVIGKDIKLSENVYPLSKGIYSENQEIEFELIPHNSESDEQIEYIARPISKTL